MRKITAILSIFILAISSILLVSCSNSSDSQGITLKEKKVVLKDNDFLRENLPRAFTEQYDKVEDATIYGSPIWSKKESGICPIVMTLGEESTGVIYFKYAGTDWIFMDKITIKTDNNKYDLNLTGHKIETDVKDRPDIYVVERVYFDITPEMYDILKDASDSQDTIIRFEGKKYSDLELTYDNKRLLRVFLSCLEKE